MMHPLTILKTCIRGIAAPFFRLRRKMPPHIEEICVKVTNLPQNLINCRLAVIADLHLPDNLADTAQILATLRDRHIDAILIAGDLTNRYNTLPTAALTAFLKDLTGIAPTFAIAGNHELVADRFPVYRTLLEDAQITFLRDEHAALSCKGENLYIYGVCDPHTSIPQDLPYPTILLIHYPERAVKADTSGCICAVCGHAHGGQVRFGKRGLFSPGQGFFPQYISGQYTVNGFPVIVSRGLGDSSLPIRIKNRPHLPIITLTSE